MTRWILLATGVTLAGSLGTNVASARHHDSKPLDTSCRPARGTTYLTIGQDLLSVADYLLVQYNASLHESMAAARATKEDSLSSSHAMGKASSLPTPAAFMVYTDIQELRGLWHPVDYGSGIEYADGYWDLVHGATLTESTATTASALQIGLWLNGTAGCRDLVEGRLEPQVHRLFHYIWSTRRPVFLRIGYEFDNPSFGYDDAALWVRAFRHVVDACVDDCRERVAFVWHSWGASTENTNTSTGTPQLNDYYPGDDYVDWIGVSLFSQVYPLTKATVPSSIPRLGNMDTVRTVLDYAQARDKPSMIAESSPFGGINVLWDPWTDWFVPVLQLIDDYDIGMWSYIHCDWEAQPMWHTIGFGDSRLSTNATVLSLWRRHVMHHSSRFIQTTVSCDAASRASVHVHHIKPKHHHHGFESPVELEGWAAADTCCSCEAHVQKTVDESWLLLLLLYPMGCFLCIYLFLYHLVPLYRSQECGAMPPLVETDRKLVSRPPHGYGTIEQQ